MDEQEIKTTIEAIKQQMRKKYRGKSEEELDKMLLDAFFKAYCDDEMSKDDLIALTCVMGYEPKYEILDEIEEQKKGEQ